MGSMGRCGALHGGGWGYSLCKCAKGQVGGMEPGQVINPESEPKGRELQWGPNRQV